MARYLNPVRFGEMGFIINIATAFLPVTLLGLEDIAVKKLVLEPLKEELIISHVLFLRLASFLLVSIMSGLYYIFVAVDRSMVFAVSGWLFCVAYNFIGCFYTFEIPYLSRVENRPIFNSRFSAYIAGTSLKAVGIYLNLSFTFLLITYLLEEVFGKLILVKQLRPRTIVSKIFRNWEDHKQYIKASIWIVIGTFFMTIENKIGFFVLGSFGEPQSLGFFTAAFMLVDLWSFVPLALLSALLPGVIVLFKHNLKAYSARIQDIHGLFFLIQIGFVTAVWLVAPYLISWLYGAEYQGAEHFLRIQSLVVFFTFSHLLRLRWFLIEDQLRLWATSMGVQLLLTTILVVPFRMGGSIEGIVKSMALSFFLTNIIFSAFVPLSRQAFRDYLLSPLHLISGLKVLYHRYKI